MNRFKIHKIWLQVSGSTKKKYCKLLHEITNHDLIYHEEEGEGGTGVTYGQIEQDCIGNNVFFDFLWFKKNIAVKFGSFEVPERPLGSWKTYWIQDSGVLTNTLNWGIWCSKQEIEFRILVPQPT